MALSRAQLTTALAGKLAQALALAGLAATDSSGALKEPLDETFRALGVGEAGLAAAVAADGAEAKALAFATFFGWDRVVAALVSKMDVKAGGGAAANLTDQVKNAERQRDRALAVAIIHGLPDYTRRLTVAPVSASGLGDEPFFARASYVVPGLSR